MKKTMILTALVAMGLVVTTQAFAYWKAPIGTVVSDPGTIKIENMNIM